MASITVAVRVVVITDLQVMAMALPPPVFEGVKHTPWMSNPYRCKLLKKRQLLAVEAVSQAGDGNDEVRFSGICFYFLTKSQDRHIDRSCEGRATVAPHMFQESFPRHGTPTMDYQELQQPSFPFG
jgi:hypothetical protein